MTAHLDVAVHDGSPVLVAREADLDFAARRLAAMAAQVSQMSRVLAAARNAAAIYGGTAARDLREAIEAYDHAAARAAALGEGNRDR